MTFIKRADLGRPLTWDEMDSNWEQVDSYAAAASSAASAAQTQAQSASQSAQQALQYQQAAEAAAASAEGAVDDFKGELASPGGAGLVGGIAKPVTWSGFSGGADPTGVEPSDNAFLAAGAYIGEVRAEGNFRLDNPVNRVNSVIELPPGSTITKNKLAGPSTANGAKIPSKTLFGRLVIRDEDTPPIGSDSFADWPDMGQALRLDSKQVQGQCGMFLGGDRRSPIIGGTAYVGFHSRHDQSAATSKIWGINPIVVKNVRAVDLPAGVDSETIGMEISVANNTNERGQPQGAGMVEGLFVSYVAYTGEGSAAITTGGLTAGWRAGLWLDGVQPDGTHIQLRDENSANAGVRCGIDTTGVNHFTDAAMLLGRGHSISSLNTGGSISPLIYISSADEIVHGNTLPHRFIGSASLFAHNIAPSTANTYTCGTPLRPWSGGFTQAAFTVTSDERYKTQDPPILARGTLSSDNDMMKSDYDDTILDAWGEVDFVQFQYLDRVEEKGEDGARWHFGVIAQRAIEAFSRHGLDAHRFAFLCYDEWEDQFEDVQTNIGETVIKTKLVVVKKSRKVIVKKPVTVRDESGNLVQVEVDSVVEEPIGKLEYIKDSDGNFVLNPETGELLQNFVQETEELTKEYESPADPVYEKKLVKAAGSRYGIRYEEALVLEAALQRRNYKRLVDEHSKLISRIEALENKS